MQIHEIQRKHKNSTKKRVGRGGKRGDYSGRGMKGQGQHASSAPRPEMRDIIKKIPKKRGYRFNSFRPDFYVVNVATLSEVFNDGDTVTPKILVVKGVMRTRRGKQPKIKILGSGEITKKLTIQGCAISSSAEEKIKKAGGVVAAMESSTITKKTKVKKETKTSKVESPKKVTKKTTETVVKKETKKKK